MFKKSLLLLAASFFIFTNVIASYAFHGSQGSSGALTAQADTQSGSASFGVPIDVPPGRAGIQPNIQLQYSSSMPNGLLGVGWSLELGSIQRSAKKGVPSYTDSDTFVLVQSGSGQELVFDSTAGFYRAKQEGAFMRIQKSGNAWVVTDKKGIKYHFGATQNAQEYDPGDTTRIFKWCLSSVEDMQGNTMTIAYWRDGNRLYPQYIDYTANPQNMLSSFARVEFVWSPRPDMMSGYTTGFLMETNYRLNRVNAWVGTNLQYRFDLTYHASSATNRSLLDTITQYGSDGTSTLPPLTFQYQEYVNQPVPAYNAVTTSLTNSSTNNNQFFGDFNGDGRADRALYDQSAGNLQVALSTGAGFQSPSVWYGNFASGVNFLSGNFDSDGVTDLCVFNPSSGNWDVLSSNGQNQFVSKGTWIPGFGANQNPGTGDFNADGLLDIVTYYEQAGDWRARVALNKGGRFEIWTARDFIIGVARTGEDDHPFAADFNGDGLTDFGSYAKTSGNWRFAMHPGSLDKNFEPLVMIPNFGNTRNFIVSDLDSDGLTDIGYYYGDVQKVIYRLSNGKTFANEQSLFLGWNVPAVQSMDLNGDGLPDFVPVETGSMRVNYYSGVFPDLLDTSDNGVGGTATVEYAPSTGYQNTLLPFPLQLVKSVSKSNNLGDVYTTRYDYARGLWDGVQREFRGFGSVKVTDPDGNYMETEFLQDEIFRGRPLEQRSYDSSGNLFSRARNLWKSQEIMPGVQFVYLSAKNNFVYDGNPSGRRTLEEYFYEEAPQLGNLTRVVQYGEVDLATGNDIPGDNRTVETAYVNNTSGSNWLAGLPRQTTVKNNAGQIVRQGWFYYDNQGNTTVPIQGFLTRKEDWAGTGNVNPVTQYSYDAIGNLSTTTDPKGNVTRVTYDTTYNMFPLTTENALAHKVTNEYFGVNGVPFTGVDGLSGLWGQVKSTTDPNQQQGKRSYDVFGRLTTTISPLDSLAYPTQTTAIQYFSDYTKVTSRQRIKSGQAQTIDTVSFYDGLGRLIQTKTPSEVLGRYVVGGQAEYDSRGLKNKQYLPYFSTNPVDTIEPVDSTGPHSTIEYDAMGRPVKTINPDGTWASASYDDWSTAAVNENGHKQASYFDAWGRLIKKEEYTGADGRSPNYPAVPYALYASTLYLYDSEGSLVQTKDAYNNTTAITYDVLGRKTAMADPDMGAWSYAYDLNGNLTRQIDAKGQTLTFTYDALNRLTNKTDGVNGTVNVNYTYDSTTVTNSKGRLTQAAYSGGNTQFAYDELGRELQSIKAMNTTNYSVNRSYDALNNLLQIQYPDQKNIYYKYNAAGQIEMIANGQLDGPVSPGFVFLESPFTHFKLNDNAGTKTAADTGTGANSAVASVNTDILSTAGRINSAFQFNGTDQYVNADGLLADIINDNTGSFTMWLKPQAGGAFLSFAGPGGYLGMEWAQTDQAVVFAMSGYSTPLSCITPTGSSPPGVYTHVAFVQDGIGLKIYINGVEQPLSYWVVANKGAWFNFNWAGPITNGRIGAFNYTSDPSNNIEFFQGGMDDIRYYKKALTASEVSGIYNKGLGTEDSMASYMLSKVEVQEGMPTGTTMLARAVSALPQPLNWTGEKTEQVAYLVSRIPYLVRDTSDEIRTTKTFLSSVGEWFERTVLGVGEAQAATTDLITLEAESMPTKTTGGATTGGWNIWSNGYIQQTVTFPNTRTYQFEIIAKGSSAAGVWPNMQLRIDQNSTGNITVNSSNWASYVVQVNISTGSHAVAVAFTNDLNAPPEDRNLKVDKIIIREVLPEVLSPAAPVLNTATAGDKQVTLSWATATGATGYKIYYGTAAGVYGTPVNVNNVTSSTVTGLTNGTKYYFVVTAYNAGGESVKSNEGSATPVSAPTQLLITLEAETMPTKTTGGAVTGGWNIWSNGYIEGTVNFPENTTYEFQIIARGAYAGGAWPNMELRIDQTVKASFTVNTTSWSSYTRQITVPSGSHKVAIAFTNDYYVAPADRNLYVDKVAILKVALGSPPAAPVLSAPAAGDKQATLSWAAATGATGYKIYYGTAAGVYGTPISVGNITASTVTGLVNGTKYYFAVSATNAGGESGKSNEVNATAAAPMTESPALFIKNVDYNASGQMTKIEYGNGDVTTYTYNSLNLRLTRLYTVNSLAQPVQDLNYTYDSAGNILSITDAVNTADQTFKYDELNRLVEAVNPNPGSYGTKTYVYDTIGNIVQKDGKTYFYGGINGGPHAVTALSDGTTFTYDANGNMVTKVEAGITTAYTYDAENRLTKVVKNGSVIGQYEYDGDGGRTKKTATVSGQTTTTTFVGSLFEKSGGRETKFIFLGGQRVAAVTNSPSIGSTTLYYHADHLGGANVLTDATGFKKELIEYEPFGQESRHEKYGSSEEVAWYYFTGKKTDDESGLIYFGARYYDPKLGRFITADTIVQNPYDPQTLNRYSYTSNNPINRIDFDGHKWSWKKFWNSFAGAFVGAVVTVLTGNLALGGMVAGAITGGLEGGWKGALIGGALGGVMGGGIGLGIGAFGPAFGVGALVAGAGVAGATGNWDSFAGGLAGGIIGAQVGNGIQSYYQDGISVQLPEGQTNPYDTKNWDMLGIGTTDAKASAFANKNGSAAFYTRSRGLLADFVRAGMQKVGGNSLASRQFSGYLRGADGFYIAMHSEGTLTLAGAIKVLSVDGVKLPNTTFDFNGPVIMRSTASNLVRMVGGSLAPSGYNLNPGDPIGIFTTPNPVMIGIYGAIGVTTLGTFHSTNYYPHMNGGR